MLDEKEIIEMLHCDSSKISQAKGIQLALQKEDLSFVMYYSSNPEYGDNCALIFTSLDYCRSEQYLDDLFSWIEDLNAVGAIRIFEYLIAAPAKLLLKSFLIALEAAVKRKNKAMINTLLSILEQNGELCDLIKDNEVALRLLEKATFRKTGDGGVS